MDTVEDYIIVASPSLRYVTPNRTMSFYLKKVNPNAKDIKDLSIRWVCINHTNREKSKQSNFFGPFGPEWLNAKWNLVGVHTVMCIVRELLGGEAKIYHYVQHVVSQGDCLSYDPATFEETENPFEFIHNIKKQNNIIETLEKYSELDEEQQEKYNERKENRKQFCDKLENLLEKIPLSHRNHFKMMSARHYSYEYPDTNSILLQVCYFYHEKTVYLLDWTNPLQQGWCGVFEGKGDTEQAALLDALDEWESDNRYPEGILKCRYLSVSHPTLEIPKYDGEGLLVWTIEDHNFTEEYQFSTDGKTWLDSISTALTYLAFGALIVAGAITLFVPSGQIATAAFWTYGAIILSATAGISSSAINITQRYNKGFSNWKDDGFDALNIVGNMLGTGAGLALAKWGPLKFLSQVGTNTMKVNAIKAMLIGEVTTNGVQGIMISTDIASAIYTVIKDKSLPPDEKLSKIMTLIGAGVLTGALVYLNLKNTKANFDFIKKDSNLVQKLSREEIDAFINDPNSIIIDQLTEMEKKSTGVALPKVELADMPQMRVSVKQLQEQNLLPLTNNTTISIANNNLPNAVIPPANYFRILNSTINSEFFLSNELNKHINLTDPFEATRVALLNSNPEGKIQILARNGDQKISKTVVNTRIYEDKRSNLQSLQADVRERISKEDGWKSKVAASKATCTIHGMDFESAKEFNNLPFTLKHALKAKVVVQGEFTGQSAPIKVVDIKGYIATLKPYYPDKKMDEATEKLIEQYLIKHKDNLSNFDGMPGAHAEILAVDDVFKQLRAKDIKPELHFKDIDVYTVYVKDPKNKEQFGQPFVACRNCSGILDPLINVVTKRKGE
ncbi:MULTISPECIES: YwqJ-related putative deaminase [unclassified Gilliamella]|uniref:YwqJ-related putative deaminase n=1 Tax=unclassified Gilliamella TaxID=2685620 RepID=UPI00226A7110|nr:MULTISPECIES: YwqJ-related putative deaminase [unclassified Gilliamella]MCX8587931.1 hypothetical protein [Gilliamella sp. B3801]MCX8591457.1 hypothetical protein [Gilliamella sp. B3804]